MPPWYVVPGSESPIPDRKDVRADGVRGARYRPRMDAIPDVRLARRREPVASVRERENALLVPHAGAFATRLGTTPWVLAGQKATDPAVLIESGKGRAERLNEPGAMWEEPRRGFR
jgi:hypothetical protein